eukprot:jgi/Hompol1/4029/HPOL_003441-RA
MQYTPQQLVEQSERAMEACQPNLAVRFLERALEVAAQQGNTTAHTVANIYQLLGVAHMEIMNLENPDSSADAVDVPAALQAAKDALYKAVELAPHENYSKYFCLGQLTIAREAIAFYETGVQLLLAEIQTLEAGGNSSHEQLAIMKHRLGGALCAMTEIYMTDLCDEPEAESKCEEYMQSALEHDATNPEVHQTLASVRLSQSRPEDARKCLEHSMDLWYREPEEDEPIVTDPNWPAYPARIALSKFLMESQLYERALAVLQTCQVENDEDPEMWYLFGWGYYQLASDNPEMMEDAQECFDTVNKLEAKYRGSVDPAILQHISELVAGKQALDNEMDEA